MGNYYMNLRRKSKRLLSRITEGVMFLNRFVDKPSRVGSITPSSSYLAGAMMSKIDWSCVHNAAELGAGTGVFTRTMLRKLKGGQLLVFEIDPTLAAMIEHEHPGLKVYGDARELPAIMAGMGVDKLDCVVSSLPFAVLPPRVTAGVLEAVDRCLRPGGKFIAYQYSRQMRPHFEKRFADVRISFVLRNVPPAFVYECTARGGEGIGCTGL
ncbi:MAG: methyltransferase domain-containing protein [Synergistaceae bacterium]|jgi:phospholipid N-methyltransferase|nr:methyltransferase domain-containing protein [Synergistaceae bacterium]